MAKIFFRRVLEFAKPGEIHEKYVPESRFIQNPLLRKAKEAALLKTGPKLHTSYSNISAQAQEALSTLQKVHKSQIAKVNEEASPLARMAMKHKRNDIPMSGPDMAQALAHHEAKIRDLKAAHLEKENAVIEAHGGKVHRQWVAPGTRLRGRGKAEPILHPSWVNYAVNINEGERHEAHLKLVEAMKAAGETKPTPGTLTREGGIETIKKGERSKLATEKTRYRREILSNKTPWKGYKSELMGGRRRTRQAMAEELGYKISSTGKIQVTGVRQIQQAQRKLAGGLKPTSPDFWRRLESERKLIPFNPRKDIPLTSLPKSEQHFLPSGPRKSVGLAGAGPEQIAAYGGEMKRIQTNLGNLVKEEQARRAAKAAELKIGLQGKADISIAKWYPSAGGPERYSRRETAVNKLLHGAVDPKRTGSPIEVAELEKHAGTIGIKVPHAKKLRTAYQKLTDVSEAGEKKIRSSILATGAPFMEAAAPAGIPAGPKYPHLQKLGIGAGIGVGVLGAGYLTHRILAKRRERRQQTNGAIAQMSARQKLIRFATRDQRTILARDRYLKQIKRADIASAIANYAKSAGVGAGLGVILKGRMPSGRAAKIGAAAGLGAQALTRATTARTKDPFGERPWQAKEVDKAPWMAGAAVGGGILIKRHAPKIWKTVTTFQTQEKEPPAWHDIATGSIEGGVGVLATDRLIRRFAPEGANVGRKLVIGAGVGGLATGAIGYSLNRLVRQKVAERKARKRQATVNNLRSRLRTIEFQMTEEEKETRRQMRRWSGRGLKARGEDIYSGIGRSYRFARDIKSTVQGTPSLDTRGRPRKKEWEKPWFLKRAALAGIGVAIGGAALIRGKGGTNPFTAWRETGPGKFVTGVQQDWKKLQKSVQPPTGAEAIKAKSVQVAATEAQKKAHREEVRHLLRMMSKEGLIRFAETLDYWDVRDYSPRQAVVTAPGGQRRYRRPKKLTERKSFREALLGTGIAAAGAIGWGAHSWRARRALAKEAASHPQQLLLPLSGAHHPPAAPAAHWTPEGFLKPRIALTSRSRLIRFQDSDKRNYLAPAVGTVAGGGGFVAGGMYRGRKMKPGEDLTGKRVTRPHSLHPLLQHEGIGIGPRQIAHLHHTPEMGKQAKVVMVGPAEFSRGGEIRILDRTVSKEAAQRAKKQIGIKEPYSLFYHNCQRFGGCARFGRSRVVPRQLRTALVAGAAVGAGGFGATKLAQSQFSRRGRIIRFRAKDDQRGSLLRKTAVIGGLGAVAAGTSLLPGSVRMLKIAGRDILRTTRGRLASTKPASMVFKPPKSDPNLGGKMVYDYIDASQKFLNKGIQGKVVGAALHHGVQDPGGVIGRRVVVGSPGHFGPGHFARFRAGPMEALRHWDYEHGALLSHRLSRPNLRPRAKAMYQDLQTRMHYGREAAHSEIAEALHHKGMNEDEALHHVATTSTNPKVHDYFNQLASSKEGAGKHYAKLSLWSPGLIAGGGGAAAAGTFLPRKDNRR